MISLAKALPALLIALVGAGIAALWFEVAEWLAVVIVLIAPATGLVLEKVGQSRIEADKPKDALRFLEAWVLLPAGIAAALIALGIWIAVGLDVGSDVDVETQKLVAAVVSAASAFLSAAVVKSSEDAGGNWLVPHIQSVLKDAYAERLHAQRQPGENATDAEQALNNDLWRNKGWGRSERRERAAVIEDALSRESAQSPE